MQAENVNQQPQEDTPLNPQNNNGVNPKINPMSQIPNRNSKNENQVKFRNSFIKQDVSTNDADNANTMRNVLKILTLTMIVMNMITLEIQCLYFNSCYGEMYEMNYWVSHSIAPIGLLLIFMTLLFYLAIEYIYKPMITVMTYLYLVLSLALVGLGLYTIIIVKINNSDTLTSSWIGLSLQSRVYYYNNSIQDLYDVYSYKMLTTGAFYIVYFIFCLAIAFLSYKHNDGILEKWRPTLQSRLSNERAHRYYEIYQKFIADHDKLSKLENAVPIQPPNQPKEENKKSENEQKPNSSRIDMINKSDNINLPDSAPRFGPPQEKPKRESKTNLLQRDETELLKSGYDTNNQVKQEISDLDNETSKVIRNRGLLDQIVNNELDKPIRTLENPNPSNNKIEDIEDQRNYNQTNIDQLKSGDNDQGQQQRFKRTLKRNLKDI